MAAPATDVPKWEGLLKWSLAQQRDGPSSAVGQATPEERAWLGEAIKAHVLDPVERLKELVSVLQIPEDVLMSEHKVVVEDFESLMEELEDIVMQIDFAKDFFTVGGYPPLLAKLKSAHPSVRQRAAQVVSTLVQNNPKVQELAMEANTLPQLLAVVSQDPDALVRTRALGAVSCLIRSNPHGLLTFRNENGILWLRGAVDNDDLRLKRKGLQLLHYLIADDSSYAARVLELGIMPSVIAAVSSDNSDVRLAALMVLAALAESGSEAASTVKQQSGLSELLERRMRAIASLGDDDYDAVEDERWQLDQLWRTCFNTAPPVPRDRRPSANGTPASALAVAATPQPAQPLPMLAPPPQLQQQQLKFLSL
eukprot:jgi/Chlat1/3639/Chrsp238S03637